MVYVETRFCVSTFTFWFFTGIWNTSLISVSRIDCLSIGNIPDRRDKTVKTTVKSTYSAFASNDTRVFWPGWFCRAEQRSLAQRELEEYFCIPNPLLLAAQEQT
jgi:hypothetical protein